MKILITGASSYVGARIFYDLQNDHQLLGTYFSNQLSPQFRQLDLTDASAVDQIVHEFQPEVIIHVANYPNSKNESDPEYKKLNLEATQTLVSAANQVEAKMVFISGIAALYDYDQYCLLKAASEKIVKTTKAGYLILRPSLVLGMSPNQVNDRTFNRWLKAIDTRQQQLKQDTVWEFYPTYIGHFAQIIGQVIRKKYWNIEVPVYTQSLQSEFSIASTLLNDYGIEVKPIQKRSQLESKNEGYQLLQSFELQPNIIEDVINTLAKEIKNRDHYKLS